MGIEISNETPIQILQKRLLNDTALRDKFHAEWRELHRNGMDMQTAIWTVRDKWLSDNYNG